MSKYDFSTLSPLDFEELARDLLQAEFGLLFESFGPGRDLGVDFRFSAARGGDTVVQVKHYTSGFGALLQAAKREDEKVARLKPARYILFTSVSLRSPVKEKLKAALPSAPLSLADIYGREDLNNLLGRHPEVEKKHFKLWLASSAVLERIVHSGLYNRTRAEMDEICTLVPKFVQNDSVPAAQAILEKSGALIIAGEPGVGKSTLARMLIWMHACEGWRVTVIDDIADAFTLSHDGERHLVFFDDFLGQVQLTPDWIRIVDQRLPPFLRRAKSTPSLRFIATTRDYILHQAQQQSERLSGADIKLSEFVLNVGIYTRGVKVRMLFNHIFFSALTADEREALLGDDFFLTIIDHRNFNPRLISLLTSPDYLLLTDGPIRPAVLAVLDNPQVLWEKPYRSHITADGRALMLALLFNKPQVPVATLEASFRRLCALGRPTSELDRSPRFRSAMRELEGSVLSIESGEISFSNPGVRDFLQQLGQLIPILDVLDTFDEVKKACEIWTGQMPAPSKTPRSSAAWAAAAERMHDFGQGSELSRLALINAMGAALSDDDASQLVDRALDELAEGGSDDIFGDYEAEQLSSVLMEFAHSKLTNAVAKKAREALTAKVAQVFEEWGDWFSIETFKHVSDRLFEFGTSEDRADEASRAALAAYLNALRDRLSEIQSLDELDAFEGDLNRLVDKYRVSHPHMTWQLQDRREELEKLEEPKPKPNIEGSGWRPHRAPGNISDDDIRSLFSTLR
jgi:hypothetical protein